MGKRYHPSSDYTIRSLLSLQVHRYDVFIEQIHNQARGEERARALLEASMTLFLDGAVPTELEFVTVPTVVALNPTTASTTVGAAAAVATTTFSSPSRQTDYTDYTDSSNDAAENHHTQSQQPVLMSNTNLETLILRHIFAVEALVRESAVMAEPQLAARARAWWHDLAVMREFLATLRHTQDLWLFLC
eukprot:UC1_evm1s955